MLPWYLQSKGSTRSALIVQRGIKVHLESSCFCVQICTAPGSRTQKPNLVVDKNSKKVLRQTTQVTHPDVLIFKRSHNPAFRKSESRCHGQTVDE